VGFASGSIPKIPLNLLLLKQASMIGVSCYYTTAICYHCYHSIYYSSLCNNRHDCFDYSSRAPTVLLQLHVAQLCHCYRARRVRDYASLCGNHNNKYGQPALGAHCDCTCTHMRYRRCLWVSGHRHHLMNSQHCYKSWLTCINRYTALQFNGLTNNLQQ
jgi:hypothetical protein